VLFAAQRVAESGHAPPGCTNRTDARTTRAIGHDVQVIGPISFMSANLVAQPLAWRMADWGDGDAASQGWMRPMDTFAERFGAVLDEAVRLGFEAVDVWTAHLHPSWAGERHVAIAKEALEARDLTVASLAGWFGATREELDASCRLAEAIGAPVLGGRTALLETDASYLVDRLRAGALRYGLENHPERTPADVIVQLEVAGDADDVIGACVDTGWFGTQGYDAADAIRELGTRVQHVHLKDVREVGRHRTCAFGKGIVPLRDCVAALGEIGYAGAISVEHEPEDYDPRPEIREALVQVRGWLDDRAA
jgi:sugar phosphate isomerase/epimerase